MKKYKILKTGKNKGRIKALRSFMNVSKGAVGGFVEKEENLSHEGDCWVFDSAKVFGNAQVSGNAEVFGNAQVSGNAEVFGDCWVSGDAQVFDSAKVSGNAAVSGNAQVFGNAQVSGNAEVTKGMEITKTCKILQTEKYHVTFSDNGYIKIGCRLYRKDHWKQFKKEEIEEMDDGAYDWWEKYKKVILLIGE